VVGPPDRREGPQCRECRDRLDDRIEAAVERADDPAQASVESPGLALGQHAEPAPGGILALAGSDEHVQLGRIPSDEQAADRLEPDLRRQGRELLPAPSSLERQLELPPGRASADPDESEVADAGASRLLVALELNDLVATVDGRERHGGPDHPAADDGESAQGQGSVNSFTVVMAFIASITPSFTPSPDALTPPKGVSSVR